ncbi:MAG: lipid kinase [Desulfatitalea sp. BRH_c12]|nr:MAG: lipid kinase [Desulfatitalea sp. BRH_c12]
MQSKSALIVVNALARQGQEDLEQVREVLRSAAIGSSVYTIENVTHMKDAIRRHGDLVDYYIVGGGDGTLNAALEPILETGLPLGVLPLGTANDLARTLEIPFDAKAAAQVIAAGRVKWIDLGWVNYKHYLNVASIGLAVKVSHALSGSTKKRWGVLAYPLSFFKAYRAMRPFRARITCNGQSQVFKSIQIAIGNGRHYGGGLAIRHDATIDDHRLNLYSLKPQPMWQLIRSAPAIVTGTMQQGDFIRVMEGEEFQVDTRKPMPIDTDGEVTTYTPARFRVKKSALQVFVP